LNVQKLYTNKHVFFKCLNICLRIGVVVIHLVAVAYSQDFSIGGEPPAAEGHWGSGGKQGGLGEESPALGDFCNFSIKRTHFYAYFGQNSYFKAITHQLKAFKINLNVQTRKIKYKFCSIHINVTKYELHLPQTGFLTPTPA